LRHGRGVRVAAVDQQLHGRGATGGEIPRVAHGDLEAHHCAPGIERSAEGVRVVGGIDDAEVSGRRERRHE
jgi:hypothetical protein